MQTQEHPVPWQICKNNICLPLEFLLFTHHTFFSDFWQIDQVWYRWHVSIESSDSSLRFLLRRRMRRRQKFITNFKSKEQRVFISNQRRWNIWYRNQPNRLMWSFHRFLGLPVLWFCKPDISRCSQKNPGKILERPCLFKHFAPLCLVSA